MAPIIKEVVEEPTLPFQYKPLSNKIRKQIQNNDPFFSLEFFPPRTPKGVNNLLDRLERMNDGGSLFVDITWHPSGDPASDKVTSSSSVATSCLNYCFCETMLHMTCVQYSREENIRHLQLAKDHGIRNILALRGDLPEDAEESNKMISEAEVPYATDFVRLIRKEFGDYFVIGVAGYPCGHPEADSYRDDLLRLKDKVDAGADFVITQLFFEAEEFFDFVNDCRGLGISVPIIPGVMPIQSRDSLRHIVRLTKLEVPKFISETVEKLKDNEKAIRNYGIALGIDLCRKLLGSGLVNGIHFYTLNKEIATREIAKGTGLWKKQTIRHLPWKAHVAHPTRCREGVRPIFWNTRPKAYVYRTKHWDEFPTGHWRSAARRQSFCDLNQEYYQSYLKSSEDSDELLKMWGFPKTEKDVWNIFHDFITGSCNNQGITVSRTPWNKAMDVAPETSMIKDNLAWCNENGMLTINSQPNVNGVPSADPVLGWGNPGGYIYRKMYLELFMSKDRVDDFLKSVRLFPSINYHIISFDGSTEITNCNEDCSIAVTWGVFPGSEIIQPTVVDPRSFRIWKDEAFHEWKEWSDLYQGKCEEASKTLQHLHDTYLLVNLVDNEYPTETSLWKLLECVVNGGPANKL